MSDHLRRALGACALLLAACAPEAPPDEVAARTGARDRAEDRTVTLITGDRVTMVDSTPVITPGPGRERIAFAIERDGGRVRVIPRDVAALLGQHRLDPALFEVTRLLADGYGDRARDHIPLILTGVDDAPGLARGLTGGVVIDRALPALHMASAHQAKAGASLVGVRGLAGGARIWLDRVRQVSLDRSVPQIGGDVAHARGLTGAGVTVAVLDTGVDAGHPDLAGVVALATDFTDDGQGPGDVLGHGTHVASIVAGRGAASGGRLAGVAPGARLISGRVCADQFCDDSAILAGMAWAATEQHARIINLSLGRLDEGAELDPLEEAVATLSAETGALFVVAAGNDGLTGAVNSPATADAALAVGAVDRDEALAVFSNQGPRLGDAGVKPELTAPGVGIVAARAAGVPPIGLPVGDAYQALSGTSMATPHVAGAAALLLQQHPDWTGAQLKAQLIASAQPNPSLGVYAQGAGRVDADRATRQAVTAEPAVLDLGIAAFPHDDDPAIVRTVSYRNAGAAPVTLALAAALTGPAGPGVITVSPATLAIPAGASADAVITVRTDGALANGLYGGALVATGGDVRVETPIGVEREGEHFELTVQLARDGAPVSGLVEITGADGIPDFELADGTLVVRLPRGRYAIDAFPDGPGATFVALPRLDLDADRTVVLDDAGARPIELELGDAGVALARASLSYSDLVTAHSGGTTGIGVPIAAVQAGPELPLDEVIGTAFATFSDDRFGEAKSIYHLARAERGHLPNGWREVIDRRELATVEAHHAGRADRLLRKGAVPFFDAGARGVVGETSFFQNVYSGSFDRTERFFGRGFLWVTALVDFFPLPADPGGVARTTAIRRYPAGARLTERWNGGPTAPAFFETLVGTDTATFARSSASRTGDQLQLQPALAADAGAPLHPTITRRPPHRRAALFRNGVLVAEQVDSPPQVFYDVPPEPATYRFEQSEERSPADFTRSIRTEAAWTFRSQHVPGTEIRGLPTLAMRFAPALDDDGATTARLLVLPIRFERPPGAGTPVVLRASLEVSFDDGAHFTRVPLAVLGDRALAVIVHPPGGAAVTLRGDATDLAGNRIEQTITRAYLAR